MLSRVSLFLALASAGVTSLAEAQSADLDPTGALSWDDVEVPEPPEGSTAPPDATSSTPAPSSGSGARLAPAIHGAVIGQALGFAFGSLAGALAWSVSPCVDPPGDPGWSCERETILSSGVGAMIVAPLGAAAGAIAGGELAGQRGDVGFAFSGALVGWMPTLLMVPVFAVTEEPLTIVIGGQLLCGIVSPLLAAISFDGRPADRAVALSPMLDVRPGLVRAGMRGAF